MHIITLHVMTRDIACKLCVQQYMILGFNLLGLLTYNLKETKYHACTCTKDID